MRFQAFQEENPKRKFREWAGEEFRTGSVNSKNPGRYKAIGKAF